MRRRIAGWLRALARRIDPNVYWLPMYRGPISQEDVDDFHNGIAPVGREVV